MRHLPQHIIIFQIVAVCQSFHDTQFRWHTIQIAHRSAVISKAPVDGTQSLLIWLVRRLTLLDDQIHFGASECSLTCSNPLVQ